MMCCFMALALYFSRTQKNLHIFHVSPGPLDDAQHHILMRSRKKKNKQNQQQNIALHNSCFKFNSQHEHDPATHFKRLDWMMSILHRFTDSRFELN